MKTFIILILFLFRFTTCFSADFKPFFNHTIKVEGKSFTKIAFDKGNETKFGVTISTFKLFCNQPEVPIYCDKNNDKKVDWKDLALTPIGDVKPIYKRFYWDKLHADKIENQAIAEFLVDFIVNSGGSVNNIKRIQRIVGVSQDGIMGMATIKAINRQSPKLLFDKLFVFRKDFYDSICKNDKSQLKFSKGWHNRINNLKTMYQNEKFI